MDATFYFAEPNLLPDQSWSLVSSIQLFLIIPKLFCFFPVSSWASLSLSLPFSLSEEVVLLLHFKLKKWLETFNLFCDFLEKRQTRFGLQFERQQETSTDFNVGVGLSDLLPAKVTWLLDFPLIFWAFKNMAGLSFQSLGNNRNMANDGGAFEPCDLFLRSYFLMKRCCHTSVTHFWLELQSRQKNWRFLFLKEGKKHLEL